MVLRRIMAVVLLTSFAVSQAMSSGCELMSIAVDGGASAAAAAGHAHHAAAPSASAGWEGAPGSGHAHHGDLPASSGAGGVPASGHSGSADCGSMMACAVAGPPATPSVVPTVFIGSAAGTDAPGAAHTGPSLAFDPPPPRQTLI